MATGSRGCGTVWPGVWGSMAGGTGYPGRGTAGGSQRVTARPSPSPEPEDRCGALPAPAHTWAALSARARSQRGTENRADCKRQHLSFPWALVQGKREAFPASATQMHAWAKVGHGVPPAFPMNCSLYGRRCKPSFRDKAINTCETPLSQATRAHCMSQR